MRQIFWNRRLNNDDIIIRFDKDISPRDILKLYLAVGWQYRETGEIKKSVNNSMVIVSAWDGSTMVGFARATGDWVFNATIWDVAVLPAYQHQGIGKLIMNSMMDKLDDYGIPLITLYTAYTKKDFYSKLGFELDSSKVIGMYRYRFKK